MATPKTPTVEPWKLKEWAEQAARIHVDTGLSLTDAVIQVLRGKKLTVAHMKRVCEEANNKAFDILFSKGRGNRSVVFEGGPADPAIVVRELKDGYASAEAQAEAEKEADFYVRQILKIGIEGESMEKVASKDSIDKRAILRSLSTAQVEYHQALEKLATEVRRASADGISSMEISTAINTILPDGNLKMAMLDDLKRMVSWVDFEKTASFDEAIINQDHPLVKAASTAFDKASTFLMNLYAAQQMGGL